MLSALSLQAGKFTRVVIDAGHGGNDNGTQWGGVRESKLTLKVAYKVAALLKAKKIPVTMTRRSDVYISKTRRAEIANRYKDVIFVSIHFNASKVVSARGVETYYASAQGRRIAVNIQRQVVKATKTRNRGVKSRIALAVLNKTKCPAVLVECGFLSNAHERRRCNTSWYQSLVARGIVKGIIQSR